jgi:hypothetical protein
VKKSSRRGLPDEWSGARGTSQTRGAGGHGGRRRFRPVRLLLTLFVSWVATVVLFSIGFIGVTCYGRAIGGTTAAPAANRPEGYARPESYSYLALPERFVVHSANEYASFIARMPPSGFPYLGSTRQYWTYYSSACAVTKAAYPFDAGYHVMLGVIGSSFTIENSLKWLYENSVGRLTEWASSTDTPEDAFARRTAQEFGTFMHSAPWYEFPFASRARALWAEMPLGRRHLLRRIERRLVLTAEYSVKAVSAWVMSSGSWGHGPARIYATVEHVPPAVLSDPRVKAVQQLGGGAYVVSLPRYHAFTKVVLDLSARGVKFVDIAGHDEILVTVLVRRSASPGPPAGRLILSAPVLTDPTMHRLAIRIPVGSLGALIGLLARERAAIEHVYDY